MIKGLKGVIAVCAVVLITASVLLIGQTADKNSAIAAPEGEVSVSVGTIDVTGTGTIKVKPDIAVLNIGVTTKGKTTEVQAENTRTMNNVLTAVKALGIDEKDIKTVNYYMNPEYDYSSGRTDNNIIGYSVYNVVEVKVRDIDRAGEVLAAASESGANVNNGISFRLSSVDEYYNEALAEALVNAKGKAEALAGAIGVKIGRPANVRENNSYYSPTPYVNYDSMAREASGGSVPIQQGELEVTASVTVTYEY